MLYRGGHYHFADWEDFLESGTPLRYLQSFSKSGGRVVFENAFYAAHLQDEWRVSPHLTLGLGLRYDVQKHDQLGSVNPLYPLTGQIPDDRDNLSARAGFAWDVAGDGRSVLRGGIGNFFDGTPAILAANATLVNGTDVVQVTQYCADGEPCPAYPDRWDSLGDLPADAWPDIYAFDPEFENPETQRLWVGYEREVLADLAFGIEVIYSRTRNLIRKQDQNLVATDELTVDGRTVYEYGTVHPELGKIVMFRSDARAELRSVVLTARKRFSDRWFLDASYTWSDARDNDSSERSTSTTRNFPEDQYDLEAEWGPSDFDVRHKLVLSGGVYLPYGFMASGYLFIRSGFPYSAYHAHDLNWDGYSESERAVIETGPGEFYHYPRNNFRQGTYSTVNMRLSKTFRLGSRIELEVIGEVFNLLDTANWYTTRWTLSSGCYHDGEHWEPCETFDTFGQDNVPGDPREYQLGLRLRF